MMQTQKEFVKMGTAVYSVHRTLYTHTTREVTDCVKLTTPTQLHSRECHYTCLFPEHSCLYKTLLPLKNVTTSSCHASAHTLFLKLSSPSISWVSHKTLYKTFPCCTFFTNNQ